MGEFEKENIEIEMVNLKYSDAVPQLAQGTIDVAVGGIEVALFNAGNQDLRVKAVMGNYFPPDAGNYNEPQTGLWCRRDSFTTPDDPDLAGDENMSRRRRWARARLDLLLGDRDPAPGCGGLRHHRAPTMQQIPSADTVTALQNGAHRLRHPPRSAVAAACRRPGYVLVATQTPGEPLGQVSFGKSLLVDNPEIGEAFVRAIVRTINTYYNGDYHTDPVVMAEIAEATGGDVDQAHAGPVARDGLGDP